MDHDAMMEFCSTHDIRLIIDAAHPFASLLHTTVAAVSEQLDLPVIRLERRYSPRDESLVWCDTFDDAIDYLESHEIRDLLALSGVQTITKLQRYWEKHPCHFRVLDRDDSREIAPPGRISRGKPPFLAGGTGRTNPVPPATSRGYPYQRKR